MTLDDLDALDVSGLLDRLAALIAERPRPDDVHGAFRSTLDVGMVCDRLARHVARVSVHRLIDPDSAGGMLVDLVQWLATYDTALGDLSAVHLGRLFGMVQTLGHVVADD